MIARLCENNHTCKYIKICVEIGDFDQTSDNFGRVSGCYHKPCYNTVESPLLHVPTKSCVCPVGVVVT